MARLTGPFTIACMNKPFFRVDRIDIISTAVASIRSLHNGFITNFYLDTAKHTLWIKKGDCFAEFIHNTVFIIKRSSSFWNVFYCSTTLEQLVNDLQSFQMNHNRQVMVFDIVGREEQCLPVVTAFRNHHCSVISSLVRMKRLRKIPTPVFSGDTVLYAKKNSIPAISNALHTYFNERVEQLPSLEELENYVQRKQVLMCEENGIMAGFLIFEYSPSTLSLRYWFTYPEFRERKVGSRLLRRFLEEGKDTARQLLWVLQSNDNAIKRYRHYGFSEENMFDYVLQFN